MVNPQFIARQKTEEQFLAHVAEEAAEFITEYARVQRWGPDSVNPLLPLDKQEKNIDACRRELKDLMGAADRYMLRVKAGVWPGKAA